MNSKLRILIILAVILSSCKKLEWNNPFDSSCPKEIWTPTNFTAVQEGLAVRLSWNQAVSQISGFKVIRQVDGALKNIPDQSKDIYVLIDNGLISGKVYSYAICAYAGNNSSNVVIAQVTPVFTVGITTVSSSLITSNSIKTGGTITTDGGTVITAAGICWSLNQNPTIADSYTFDGKGLGSFSSTAYGLSPGKIYYIRAYATNFYGTSYGNQVTATTSAISPSITTTTVTSITTTTATSGGTIISNGGAPVTASGVCWSTSSTPTIANTKTTDGTVIGSFSSAITGLTANTIYYVRAYATNSAGTAYGSIEAYRTLEDPTMPPGIPGTITDIDGNSYNTVAIGTQVWMASNLKTTKYNDGTSIPLVTDNSVWQALLTPGYCWYNNDATTYKITYGALYNWFTVNTGKLCPTGWHVPSDAEWSTLTTYLDYEGGKLKEAGTSHWSSPNTGANNLYGFTALPGGRRSDSGTAFSGIGDSGSWWSSTEYSTAFAWGSYLHYRSSGVGGIGNSKQHGFSVRCLRD